MKKKLILGLILLTCTGLFVSCNENPKENSKGNQEISDSNKPPKKELSNSVSWNDKNGNFAAAVTVNNIRRFTEKDKLYKNIIKDNKDKDLYLVNYTYKNGDLEDKLEFTLNNFKFYTPSGELLDNLANGADSFKGEISKNKSATTDFIIAVPKDTKLEHVTFEVGNNIFPNSEGEAKVTY